MRPFEGGADGATLWDPEGYDHASKSFKAVADDSSESENDDDETTTTDDEAPEGCCGEGRREEEETQEIQGDRAKGRAPPRIIFSNTIVYN